MDPEYIINFLKKIGKASDFFNPYVDVCNVHDSLQSPSIRRKNLYQYLEVQYRNRPVDLWIAEAGSYNGLRRTGLPLIPESKLLDASGLLNDQNMFAKATLTPAVKAYSAGVIWDKARHLETLPFLWNIVMVHTHKQDFDFSNRNPTKDETLLFRPLLEKLVKNFEFERIICIGRVAHRVVQEMGFKSFYVRHPAQGGVKIFKNTIKETYISTLDRFE
jgi:hypothetical protein